MGAWRGLKRWVKRTAVRIFLKIARTRFVRYVRKIVRASPIPLVITGGGAAVGAGVASAVALPLGYGALIGAGIAMAGLVVTKLYLKSVADAQSRRRLKLNYTIRAIKEKSSSRSGRSYVVEAEATSSGQRF